MSSLAREHLPRRRSGYTTAVTVGGERFSFTANAREDGSLAEVLLRWGKHGSAGAGLMDAYATALSVGLEHGVALASLLRPALGLSFAPSGHTDDPEIPRARSVADYLARRLAIDWLPPAERAELGIFTISELVERTRREQGDPHRQGARERRWDRWAGDIGRESERALGGGSTGPASPSLACCSSAGQASS